MKHTPGPWAVHPALARVDAGFHKDDPGFGEPVCELLWPTDIRSEAETEANAHLIAAAPDLLEALKRLERTVRILPTEMDEPDSPLAQARAAIAKAESQP